MCARGLQWVFSGSSSWPTGVLLTLRRPPAGWGGALPKRWRVHLPKRGKWEAVSPPGLPYRKSLTFPAGACADLLCQLQSETWAAAVAGRQLKCPAAAPVERHSRSLPCRQARSCPLLAHPSSSSAVAASASSPCCHPAFIATPQQKAKLPWRSHHHHHCHTSPRGSCCQALASLQLGEPPSTLAAMA